MSKTNAVEKAGVRCTKCGVIDASGLTPRTASTECDPHEWKLVSIRLKFSDRAWFLIGDENEDLGMIAHMFPNPKLDYHLGEYIVSCVNDTAEIASLRDEVERLKNEGKRIASHHNKHCTCLAIL